MDLRKEATEHGCFWLEKEENSGIVKRRPNLQRMLMAALSIKLTKRDVSKGNRVNSKKYKTILENKVGWTRQPRMIAGDWRKQKRQDMQ